jgi:hypothetical protein
LGTHRWKSAIKVSQTIPAVDCGCDHELLRSKLDLEHIPEEYKHAVGKGFEILAVRNRDSDNLWVAISRVITGVAMKNIPEKRNKKGPKWLTKEPLRLQKRDGKQNK